MAGNKSWMPISLSDFHYTDCKSMEFFYNTVFINQTNDFPMVTTNDLLRNGLSEYWSRNNITPPLVGELLGWVMDDWRSDNTLILDSIDTFVRNNETCHDEVCKSLTWQGNSDQAGRGVCYNDELRDNVLTSLDVGDLLHGGRICDLLLDTSRM